VKEITEKNEETMKHLTKKMKRVKNAAEEVPHR